MKRRLFKVLLFLLTGAIINIAVAWGFGLFLPWPAKTENWTELTTVQHWPRTVQFKWPSRPQVTSVRTNLVTIVRHFHVEYALEKLTTFNHERYGFGWPARSLACELCWQEVSEGMPPKVIHQAHAHRGVWQRNITTGGGFEVIPLLPVWPGFAINTIFYAAIAWGLFAVPGAVRRTFRRKHGQCAACGYSLRGTPHNQKCTECGAAVPPKS